MGCVGYSDIGAGLSSPEYFGFPWPVIISTSVISVVCVSDWMNQPAYSHQFHALGAFSRT
jgi:hypothetical protein